MPKWIATLLGKYLKSKVKLEDTMDDKKPWYKSKSILTGIVAVLLAGYTTAAGQFGLPAVPEWIFGLLAGFGVYSRATATQKIG